MTSLCQFIRSLLELKFCVRSKLKLETGRGCSMGSNFCPGSNRLPSAIMSCVFTSWIVSKPPNASMAFDRGALSPWPSESNCWASADRYEAIICSITTINKTVTKPPHIGERKIFLNMTNNTIPRLIFWTYTFVNLHLYLNHMYYKWNLDWSTNIVGQCWGQSELKKNLMTFCGKTQKEIGLALIHISPS